MNGTTQFKSPDGSLASAATKATSPTAGSEYRLWGRSRALGLSKTRTYLGLPDMRLVSAAGTSEDIEPGRITWRPRLGNDSWRSWSQSCLGEVVVQVRDGNEVCWTGAATILPEHTHVTVDPGARGTAGALLFEGLSNPDISVTEPQDLDHSVTRNGDEIRLCFDAAPDDVEDLTVRFEWPAGASATFRFPFPAIRASFDGDGRKLSSGAEVSVETLSLVEARTIVPSRGTEVYIEMSPQSTRQIPDANRLRIRRPMRAVGPGHYQMNMGEITEPADFLLSVTSQLDASVRLEVQSNLVNLPRITINVTRYDLRLVHDPDLGEIQLDEASYAKIGPEEIARISARAFSVGEPWRPEIGLTQVRAGTWQGGDPPAGGPWLVCMWDGQWCRSRPLLWQEGRGDPTPIMDQESFHFLPEADSILSDADPTALAEDLDLKASLKVPAFGERIPAMRAALKRLASDPFSEDLQILDALIPITAQVHPSALDLVTALVDAPEALAVWALRAPTESTSIAWDQLPRLPFLWELVPTSCWESATRALCTARHDSLLPHSESLGGSLQDLIQGEVERGQRRVMEFMPHLEPVFAVATARELGLELPGPISILMTPHRSFILHPLPQARQDLMRRQSGTWDTGIHMPDLRKRYRRRFSIDELWSAIAPDRDPGYRLDVLSAPIVVAAAALEGDTLGRDEINEIRRLRAFDPEWFREAHRAAFLYLFGFLHAPDLPAS